MKQEDKELLLKDLCARLPYGVICNVQDENINKDYVLTDIHTNGYGFENNGIFYDINSFVVKPYLRSFASMTVKEFNEFLTMKSGSYDRVLSEHLDFRGLIPKGLAIEAPIGMYKVEE